MVKPMKPLNILLLENDMVGLKAQLDDARYRMEDFSNQTDEQGKEINQYKELAETLKEDLIEANNSLGRKDKEKEKLIKKAEALERELKKFIENNKCLEEKNKLLLGKISEAMGTIQPLFISGMHREVKDIEIINNDAIINLYSIIKEAISL